MEILPLRIFGSHLALVLCKFRVPWMIELCGVEIERLRSEKKRNEVWCLMFRRQIPYNMSATNVGDAELSQILYKQRLFL